VYRAVRCGLLHFSLDPQPSDLYLKVRGQPVIHARTVRESGCTCCAEPGRSSDLRQSGSNLFFYSELSGGNGQGLSGSPVGILGDIPQAKREIPQFLLNFSSI